MVANKDRLYIMLFAEGVLITTGLSPGHRRSGFAGRNSSVPRSQYSGKMLSGNTSLGKLGLHVHTIAWSGCFIDMILPKKVDRMEAISEDVEVHPGWTRKSCVKDAVQELGIAG